MRRFKRVVVILLSSVGIGEAADADKFSDQGSDTLGHVCDYWRGSLALPTLTKLGLGNIPRQSPLTGILATKPLISQVGRMQEISAGKDSLNGHWEMMGAPLKEPLDTFPNGFSCRLIHKIETFSNRKVILNRPAATLTAIKNFGQQQSEEGDLIVYTPSDSVLQVSSNEAVVPLEELYRICRYIRFVVDESHLEIGRVVARPFIGKAPSDFKLTDNRRDFAIVPKANTVLDFLAENHTPVSGIGMVNDLFSGRGIENRIQIHNKQSGFYKLLETMETQSIGLIFADLGNLDKYGHARDPQGYGIELMRIDSQLKEIIEKMTPADLILITADHGNDPTFKGSDHTREFVPLIAASPNANGNQLGIRSTFSDLGKTILSNFEIGNQLPGKSFLNQIS
ncbi:phosphopentomutase [Lentilactobacillus hilgardii]|nr:phosphopentomutase [Lentilactobacillus hilgardii]MCV3740581.1 phosphopentomutase [Lentilactobacillus hilgardii]